MKEVDYITFLKRICKDYNTTPDKDYVLNMPWDKVKMKAFTSSRAHDITIVAPQGEFPYMLSQTQRNDEMLKKAINLVYHGNKTLDMIIKECNPDIKISDVKISEGGGWYSNGKRYAYKDLYVEF